MDLISLIIPCYNEGPSLPRFYTEINHVSEKMPGCEFEFIFVDDGSEDKTLSLIKELRQTDSRVRFLSFSRNFGKEAGILAGLRASRGKFAAVMDADLQDPPSLLPEMYIGITKQGYDCVAARRVSRAGETPVRSFFARWFYRLMSRLTSVEMGEGARDFRLMSRKMVDAILSLPETGRFSKGIFSWVGFKTKWLDYEYAPRSAGETKWSFWSLIAYAAGGVFSFSQAPLALSSVLGILLFFVSALMLVFIIARRLLFGDPVSGWASMICVVIFIGSIQFLCMGIMGQYLARMYLEVKNRPMYFIRETEEDTEHDG